MFSDSYRRSSRITTAIGTHWLKAAADIENRYYSAMRLADLPNNEGYVESDARQCMVCKEKVAIDKRLIPLAERSKGIVCSHCTAKQQGRPYKSIMLDQLNKDYGEEL